MVVPDPYVIYSHVHTLDGEIVDGAVLAAPNPVIEFDALPAAVAADLYRPVADPLGRVTLTPTVRLVLPPL